MADYYRDHQEDEVHNQQQFGKQFNSISSGILVEHKWLADYFSRQTDIANGPLTSNVLFLPRITSTQTLARKLQANYLQAFENASRDQIHDSNQISCSPFEDFMVITDYQYQGRGRRDKEWLSQDNNSQSSADASLTFTFTRTVPYSQVMNYKLYPYLVGVALTRSLNTLFFSANQEGVKLKWPNDAYLGGLKFSGCLEEAEKIQFQSNSHRHITSESIKNPEMGKVFIGIGINLAESHGFTCLKEHLKTEEQIKLLTKLNIMNEFTREFLTLEPLLGMQEDQQESKRAEGRRKLLDMYEQLWMHQGQKVSVELPESQMPGIRLEGIVSGISDEGFLKVKVGGGNSGVEYETYPSDDYSFDIKQSKIIRKLK